MRNTGTLFSVGWVVLSLATGACTLTPPPTTPAIVQDIRSSEDFVGQSSITISSSDNYRWWVGVGGDELDALVSSLKRDSLVLQEARSQLEQAREAALSARGQRLPTATAFTDVSTDRSPDLAGAYSWSETYSSGMLLDLNSDIFGGLRTAQRAAELTSLSSEFSLEATEQREIAILAKSWISAATLVKRLELAQRNVDSFRSTYNLTNDRYSAGSSSVTASDVQIALQNFETARVDIPELETELEKQLYTIDEQLGHLPGTTKATFVGDLLSVGASLVPVGRPANMLANRPDVAAAELRYLAALEDVGAARANLYPAISLSASLTFQSDTPGEVFDWDRHIASLANSLTAPLFQGGRLKSQVRAQQARAEELATAFARTALSAMIDVEIALADVHGLEEQRRQLELAVKTAKLSNELAQGRYGQGLTSILAVLETQRSLNAAEQNLLLTDQAIANARVDLFLSLGGDWFDLASDADSAVQS